MTAPSEGEAAYAALLDATEERLREIVAELEELAATVDPSARAWSPHYLTNLGYRLGLSRLYGHVLSACHELHGARIQLIMARVDPISPRSLPP